MNSDIKPYTISVENGFGSNWIKGKTLYALYQDKGS